MKNALLSYSLIYVVLLICLIGYNKGINDFYNTILEVDESLTKGEKQIHGKMEINGITYNTVCDCDQEELDKDYDKDKNKNKDLESYNVDTQSLGSMRKSNEKELESSDNIKNKRNTTLQNDCDKRKLTVKLEKKGIGASYNDIKNLLGDINELKYVKITETSFKCVDGRNSKAMLGTPGGDAGEFILALTVYEDLLPDKKLTQEDVDRIFSEYLSKMKHENFYLCSDDAALNHLQKSLSVLFTLINIR